MHSLFLLVGFVCQPVEVVYDIQQNWFGGWYKSVVLYTLPWHMFGSRVDSVDLETQVHKSPAGLFSVLSDMSYRVSLDLKTS